MEMIITQENFVWMDHFKNGSTIRLRAIPEYTKEKLKDKYQVGDTWYFTVFISDDGDYVTSDIQRGQNNYTIQIEDDVRLDVLDFCDRNQLR